MTTPPASSDASSSAPEKKKNRNLLLALVVVLVALAVLGHFTGSSKKHTSSSATTATTEPVSATTTSSDDYEPTSVTLTCADGPITGVTVRRTGDDAQVTWTGRAPAASESNGFFVTVSNGNDIVRQLGKQIFTSGEIVQFVFDMSSARQTNLPTDGKGLAALDFPGAFTGITGSAQVDATVSVNGADAEQCKA